MMEENTEKRPVAVRIDVAYPEGLIPVECITFAKFSHFGGQVMMDLGLMDDQALIKVISERIENASVTAHVLHRYGMSVETFQLLRKNITEIAAKMTRSGLLKGDTEAEEQ